MEYDQFNQELIYDVDEVATLLDYSRRKVHRLIKEGKIVKVEGRINKRKRLVTHRALMNYIKSITIPPEFWKKKREWKKRGIKSDEWDDNPIASAFSIVYKKVNPYLKKTNISLSKKITDNLYSIEFIKSFNKW